MTSDEFVRYVKAQCKYYGVKIYIGPGRRVNNDGFFCSGYFDDERKILAVDGKLPDFLEILVHEYCHLTQWRDQAAAWMRAEEMKTYQAWAKHLAGGSVENMGYHFDIMRDVELDNERRVVQMIKALKLPINTREYTKRANAYIMLYNHMKEGGKWPGKNKVAPHRNPRIMAIMPDRFCMNYERMTPKVRAIFKAEM